MARPIKSPARTLVPVIHRHLPPFALSIIETQFKVRRADLHVCAYKVRSLDSTFITRTFSIADLKFPFFCRVSVLQENID
jgi:hypothetical protein